MFRARPPGARKENIMADKGRTNPEVEAEVRRSFEKMLESKSGSGYETTLTASWVATPVGTMLAVADDKFIRLLSFLELSIMERKADLIQQQLGARLVMGDNGVLQAMAGEMQSYFTGALREFATPILLHGTSFQLSVWDELRRVPFGSTVSYADLAQRIGKPAAFRAVAQANAQNPIQVVIPCHRVINSDGRVGGYIAGVERKRWLLDFERGVLEDS